MCSGILVVSLTVITVSIMFVFPPARFLSSPFPPVSFQEVTGVQCGETGRKVKIEVGGAGGKCQRLVQMKRPDRPNLSNQLPITKH